jgi:hypothetical protein
MDMVVTVVDVAIAVMGAFISASVTAWVIYNIWFK